MGANMQPKVLKFALKHKNTQKLNHFLSFSTLPVTLSIFMINYKEKNVYLLGIKKLQ